MITEEAQKDLNAFKTQLLEKLQENPHVEINDVREMQDFIIQNALNRACAEKGSFLGRKLWKAQMPEISDAIKVVIREVYGAAGLKAPGILVV
jgi:hypothetical protein